MRNILLLIWIASVQAYAYLPVCDGTCGECRLWMPLLKQAALELKNDYLQAENELSNRYNSIIMPKLEERKRLLELYDRLLAETEILNKLIAVEVKKHNHERE